MTYKAEFKSLPEGGFVKMLMQEDLSPDGNIFSYIFLLAIKYTEEVNMKHQARYMIGGRRDKYINLMAHFISLFQPKFVTILLALAGIFDFYI